MSVVVNSFHEKLSRRIVSGRIFSFGKSYSQTGAEAISPFSSRTGFLLHLPHSSLAITPEIRAEVFLGPLFDSSPTKEPLGKGLPFFGEPIPHLTPRNMLLSGTFSLRKSSQALKMRKAIVRRNMPVCSLRSGVLSDGAIEWYGRGEKSPP